MQVICPDGTTFTCQGYELTKYGVKLLDEDRDDDDERYDTAPSAVGYVPHDRLWYIVPDGVRPNGPPTSTQSPAPRGQETGSTANGPGPGQPAPNSGPAPGPRR